MGCFETTLNYRDHWLLQTADTGVLFLYRTHSVMNFESTELWFSVNVLNTVSKTKVPAKHYITLKF